jgi:hypothetical protein
VKHLLIAVCALLVFLPCATAQRAGHASSYHARFNSSGRFAAGHSSRAAGFGRRAPYTSLPFPLFSDTFSLEDLYASGYPVASQPPVMLIQPDRGRVDSPDNTRSSIERGQSSSSEPLMIELQNGRYVHVNRSAVDGEAAPLSFDSQSSSKTRGPQASTPQDRPSAVLIFRDGHSVEVRDYTIANGMLYASGDYYSDGYWSKQIAISILDLPETLRANAGRSVKFVLPAAPNEVIASF